MKNPVTELTKAYYDLLVSATGLPVYDGIAPNNSGNDYIIIGERTVIQNQDKNDFFTEVLFVFQIVTKGLGTGYKKANDYSDDVLAVINSDDTDAIIMDNFKLNALSIVSINNLHGLNPADNQFSIIIRVNALITEIS
jgi:hypothetical protein